MRTPVIELDELFRSIVGDDDVVTAAELAAAGVTTAQLRTAVRTGRWYSVGRGVYALAPVPEEEPDRWARVVAGAQVRSRVDAVAWGRTAAALHGLPLLGDPPTRPQLVQAEPTQRRQHVRAVGLDLRDVVTVRGVRATSVPRTAVDLARTAPFLDGVMVLDAALHAGVSLEELQRTLAGTGTVFGRKRADAALSAARVGAQSPLETLGRLRLVERGGPEPALQKEVRDERGRIGFVDQLWLRERVIAEADGLSKYRLQQAERPDSDPLAEEKERQLRLEAVGFVVIRYGWDDAWYRPDQLAGRVWAALDKARRRQAG